MEPATRDEQINEALKFIINDPVHYEALKHTPRRLEAACIKAVVTRYNGYHLQVVRRALIDLNTDGKIDYQFPPYDHDDLYG